MSLRSKDKRRPVKLLTTKDHFEVTEFLRNLDKNELIRLGEALGLSYSKLKKMEPLCEEMVDAWLKQEEDVIEQSGEPSWKSLKAALKKIGQTGLIRTIITDTLASSKKKLSPLDLATSATASAVVVDDVKTQTSPNIDSKSHLGNHSGKEHVNMHISPPLSTGDEVTSKSTHSSNVTIDIKMKKSLELERCDPTRTASSNDEGGSEMKDRFPYLKVEHLDKEEKKRLMGRLVKESKHIRLEYGSLVVQTMKSLSVTCKDVSALKTLLVDILKIPGINESDYKIDELLSKTFKHCSFFSYEILKSIISDFGTSNDKERLTKYNSRFKVYCKRRLCEVPIETKGPSMQNKKQIYIKTDKVFDVPADEVYELESELSEMFDIPVYLHGWEPGSITLIFYTFHELNEIFPLNEKKIDQLKGIGVLKLFYSKSKDIILPSIGKLPSLAQLQQLPSSPLPSTASSLDSSQSLPPSYYASTIDAYSSLFVRLNHPIALSSMESLLKNLLLGLTILNFHEERNGLYEFKYPRECGPKVFPLSYKQERKLLEIGVQSLDCETYEFHLAFERDPLSPAPPYFGAVIGDYSSLFVRVDHLIISMKTFEHDLSSILDLRLNFYAEDDGCYEFKFKYPLEHEVFPLSQKQKRKLLNIGVQLLDCYSYRFLPVKESITAIYPQSHEGTSSSDPEPLIPDDVNMIQHERSLGSWCISTCEDSLQLPRMHGDAHHNGAQLLNDTKEGIPPSAYQLLDLSSEDLDSQSLLYNETVSNDLPQRVKDPDFPPAYGNQDPPQTGQDLPSPDSSSKNQDDIQLLEPDNDTRKCYKDCFPNTRKCCKDCFSNCCKDCFSNTRKCCKGCISIIRKHCILVIILSCILMFISLIIILLVLIPSLL